MALRPLSPPIKALKFLRFPLSPLPSPPKSFSSSDEFIGCCTVSSAKSVSHQLPSLPIDEALSKFYSDVLPHTIDAYYCDFSTNPGSSYGDVQIPQEQFLGDFLD